MLVELSKVEQRYDAVLVFTHARPAEPSVVDDEGE